ncbi:MAG: hypothetical protein Q9M91_05460 [Candidatus Dojkabacteria bacterium]|nr:hypothetical protein [Candidatus Dojkabacteria bacterium]MDQ7021250.1 hypothetical protein [Candidatus Dojkabacteria bacterium]
MNTYDKFTIKDTLVTTKRTYLKLFSLIILLMILATLVFHNSSNTIKLDNVEVIVLDLEKD